MAADDDPATRVTDQPALTTSQGTIWLVVGGLMSAVAVGLLWWLREVDTTGVALIGIAAVALLYVGMVEVRLLVRGLRVRLAAMAVLFGLIAVAALVFVLVIGMSAG
jgi:hypothetical protein